MHLSFSIHFCALTAQHEGAYETLLGKDFLQAARVGKDWAASTQSMK